MLRLEEVTPDTRGFDALRIESEQQGQRMLTRFAENWRNGSNRFNRPGELVLGVHDGDRLVGLCGRNRDPFDTFGRAGRVRHLYVARAYRRRGTARLLVERVIDGASQWFDYLNTNCPPEAAGFYERLGFAPAAGDHVTHRLALRP